MGLVGLGKRGWEDAAEMVEWAERGVGGSSEGENGGEGDANHLAAQLDAFFMCKSTIDRRTETEKPERDDIVSLMQCIRRLEERKPWKKVRSKN